MRGAAEDEERTSVGRDECMEGGLEGSGQKHVCRREDCGMSDWVSGEEEWFVREPESVEESLERNCCQEYSGKVGNGGIGSKENQKQLRLEEGLTDHGEWIWRKGGTMGDGKPS